MCVCVFVQVCVCVCVRVCVQNSFWTLQVKRNDTTDTQLQLIVTTHISFGWLVFIVIKGLGALDLH